MLLKQRCVYADDSPKVWSVSVGLYTLWEQIWLRTTWRLFEELEKKKQLFVSFLPDGPKVKDSWRKHFDACKSLATFVKCYVDRTTLSCPQIYIYIYPLLRWGHLWRRNSFCDFGSPYVSAMLLLCFFVASFHHREEKRLTLDHKSYINVQVSPGGHEFRRQCFECSKKFDFISKCWPLQL